MESNMRMILVCACVSFCAFHCNSPLFLAWEPPHQTYGRTLSGYVCRHFFTDDARQMMLMTNDARQHDWHKYMVCAYVKPYDSLKKRRALPMTYNLWRNGKNPMEILLFKGPTLPYSLCYHVKVPNEGKLWLNKVIYLLEFSVTKENSGKHIHCQSLADQTCWHHRRPGKWGWGQTLPCELWEWGLNRIDEPEFRVMWKRQTDSTPLWLEIPGGWGQKKM